MKEKEEEGQEWEGQANEQTDIAVFDIQNGDYVIGEYFVATKENLTSSGCWVIKRWNLSNI